MLRGAPTAGKLAGFILPEYSQLLLGCSLSALLLCTPIFVYTNHVRRMAMLTSPRFDSQGLLVNTSVSESTVGTGEWRKDVLNVQKQAISAIVNPAHQQIAAGSGSWGRKQGNTFALRRERTIKRIPRQMSGSATARGGRVSKRLSRTWARNRVARRVQMAWVAIWHENAERLSKTKAKSSGS